MKVLYIADDGTQFDDEWDCRDYEFRKDLDLDDIEMYDEDGNRLDPMTEETYYTVMRIVIKTERAAEYLAKIENYTGFIAYADVKTPGVWVYDQEAGFIKEENENE